MIKILIPILFIINIIYISAETIEFNKDRYTIKFEMNIKCEKEKLLETLFKFENLKNTVSANEIKLLEESPTIQKVEYTFNFLFVESKMIYRRTLNILEGKIEFQLENIKQSSDMFPRMKESTGYSKITTIDSGNKIEYFQETLMDRNLSDVDKYFMKSQLDKQIDKIKEYYKNIN